MDGIVDVAAQDRDVSELAQTGALAREGAQAAQETWWDRHGAETLTAIATAVALAATPWFVGATVVALGLAVAFARRARRRRRSRATLDPFGNPTGPRES